MASVCHLSSAVTLEECHRSNVSTLLHRPNSCLLHSHLEVYTHAATVHRLELNILLQAEQRLFFFFFR